VKINTWNRCWKSYNCGPTVPWCYS